MNLLFPTSRQWFFDGQPTNLEHGDICVVHASAELVSFHRGSSPLCRKGILPEGQYDSKICVSGMTLAEILLSLEDEAGRFRLCIKRDNKSTTDEHLFLNFVVRYLN